MRIGAFYQGNGSCLFRVFAPEADRVSLEFTGRSGGLQPLRKQAKG